ncbi:MAG TPA: PepSY-associated TM helix domain-containing protein [Candidatus Nitrosotalea sp.]|nr:PepSY-associated TM helix domain-containing protein [Candidatus Nitrosotalea sp.]
MERIPQMKGRLYRLTRDLHLYFGLFISPFVLVFSISVFFLVHSWIPTFGPETARARVVSSLNLPAGLPKLSGRPLVDALKPVLESMNVPGEIGFVQHRVKEETLIIPVSIPGRATSVSIDLARREATIVTRETGLADALITLHKSPGQHGPDIRMNWFVMKVWRWFADATVYLILFISVSGIYLWHMLRSERKAGWVLLLAGAVTFFGMAYVVSH